jgi:hypothetical protein
MVCLNGLNIDLKIAKFQTNIGRKEIISEVKNWQKHARSMIKMTQISTNCLNQSKSVLTFLYFSQMMVRISFNWLFLDQIWTLLIFLFFPNLWTNLRIKRKYGRSMITKSPIIKTDWKSVASNTLFSKKKFWLSNNYFSMKRNYIMSRTLWKNF